MEIIKTVNTDNLFAQKLRSEIDGREIIIIKEKEAEIKIGVTYKELHIIRHSIKVAVKSIVNKEEQKRFFDLIDKLKIVGDF